MMVISGKACLRLALNVKVGYRGMTSQPFTNATVCKLVLFCIVVFVAVQYLYVSTTSTYSHERLFYFPFNGVSSKQSDSSLLHQQLDSKTPYSSNLAALLLANATVGPSVLEILVAHAGHNTSNSPASSPTNPEDLVNNNNSTANILCPVIPPNLIGPVKVRMTTLPEETIELLVKGVTPGGHFKPAECRARSRVAIIIPYRDRVENLNAFLYHMHPFLQKQQLEYGIIVVEQEGSGLFNRAMLMNVGFVESQKLHEYDCFVFHDVDLLPEDDRNLYSCPEQPRHMSVAVSSLKYRLPYKDLFGGVGAMTLEQFKTVNGFSNKFWGWGGEDDDMSNRVRVHGYHISRYPATIARYKMMPHRRQPANPKRYEYLMTGNRRFKTDGLNSLNYVRVDLKLQKLYTWVLVQLSSSR